MEKSRFDYVVFDIETTGLNPKSDRICEIGAIGVRGGLPQETFSTLVSIGGKMPARATEINGITDEMLAGAPAIGEALYGFIEFIGDMPMLVNRLTSPYSVIREEMLFEVLDSEVLVLDASLGGAISSLPETEQAIILLYYFAEWTDKRIAAELGCPRSTVQLKRTRALDMLRKYLEEEGVCCRDRDEL